MAQEIFKRILAVQAAIVAPKTQFNAFGKYKYRRAEDILEALKPLLKANELTISISDEPVFIEGRFYIKATVTVYHGDESHSVTAYAREGETKSGMDPAQITGATSSYARKYALGGMFCIDDNDDPDVTNTHGQLSDGEETKGAKKGPQKADKEATPTAMLDDAIKAVYAAKNRRELNKIWNDNAAYQNNPDFLKAAGEMAKKYPKATK